MLRSAQLICCTTRSEIHNKNKRLFCWLLVSISFLLLNLFQTAAAQPPFSLQSDSILHVNSETFSSSGTLFINRLGQLRYTSEEPALSGSDIIMVGIIMDGLNWLLTWIQLWVIRFIS
jgi:hypothetical protein